MGLSARVSLMGRALCFSVQQEQIESPHHKHLRAPAVCDRLSILVEQTFWHVKRKGCLWPADPLSFMWPHTFSGVERAADSQSLWCRNSNCSTYSSLQRLRISLHTFKKSESKAEFLKTFKNFFICIISEWNELFSICCYEWNLEWRQF